MAEHQGAALAFTKLIVSDLEAMTRFYCEVFEFEEATRIQAEMSGESIDEIFLGRDGDFTGLCLFCYIGREPAHNEVILGFSTPDIVAAFERAKALGATVSEPVKVEQAGGRIMGFLEDPEGHVCEVMQEP
jgi:predicted enzyme related to lactoylglutathione lyase